MRRIFTESEARTGRSPIYMKPLSFFFQLAVSLKLLNRLGIRVDKPPEYHGGHAAPE